MARARPLQTALFGSTPLALYCGEVLLARGHAIVGVVGTGAGVQAWAGHRGLAVFADEAQARLPETLDLLLEVGHPDVLAPTLVARARHAVRFHDGPLPAYAGHHVTTWALLAGETQHAVCWHAITGRGQGGPLLAQARVAIEAHDTTADLDARCLAAGVASFPQLLEALEEGRLRPEPQSELRRQWHGRHRSPPGAGALDWRRPAGQLARTIRALCGATSSPIAWATLAVGREAVVVEQAEVEAREHPSEPGTVLALDPLGLTVAAGAGALRIQRIWRQDGRALRFTDLPVTVGEVLPLPDLAALEELDQTWRPDADFWVRRLAEAEPLPVPWGEVGVPEAGGRLVRLGLDDGAVLTAACVLLARAAEAWHFDVAVTDAARLQLVGGLDAWFCPHVPMRMELDPDADRTAAAAVVLDAWRAARRSGHRRDLGARLAGRRGPELEAVLLARVDDAATFTPPREAIVACAFDGVSARWWAPASILGPLERGFAALLKPPDATPIGRLSLLSPADAARLDALHGPTPPPSPLRVSDAVLGRAAATPDADALVADGRPLSFASFEVRVNRLARHLQSLGLGRGDRVATLLPDVGDALVATLAVLTAGATAVPLDPATRPDRLARQQTDARVDATVTCEDLRAHVSQGGQIISVDTDRAIIEAWPADPLPCPADAADTACVVFAPEGHRGVALSHAQLVGLFSAIDEVVEERPGVWLGLGPPLAATGVVDRLWALSRGFEVLAPDPAAERAATLSLACASSDPVVLAGVARFADRHGFEALWLLDWGVAGATLPDAAVAAAAAATGTERVGLRAVTRLPADPDRLLEIWSLINGLSAGRLGLAVIPESPRRLEGALAQLRTVGGADAPPPAWVVAEEGEAFAAAGRAGASVVTVIRAGLLADLPGLVLRYRAGRADAGHAGPGQVTLVVPTLIGDDDQTVRAWARAPLASWLRRLGGPREPVGLDQVALAGDAARARTWLAGVARAGVDEVACLVDFGLPAATLRAHLPGLGLLRQAPPSEGDGLADRLQRDGVTHLEVPVERLRRLLSEPGQALGRLRHVIITGDPLPADLARATRAAVGPGVQLTRRLDLLETGGWCTAHGIAGDEATLPLGVPLAHLRAHVLDSRGEAPPLGAPGELCVGGPGVTVQGLHPARRIQRPDGPLLRTGLRVRQSLDGTLEPVPRPLPPPTEPPEAEPTAPFDGTPLERAAATVIRAALGTRSLPAADVDLFGRLADPAQLVRIAAELSDALNREVSLAALFEHRSIRALVRHLRAEADPTSGQRSGRKRRRRRD
ncbi:MAG: LLM class flavin-dependent oxidoreductase [Myxococcales bacterium]|nr:LLM class flavin-dependent oxidoreductase [Myxococcales bacterium]